MTYYIDLFQGNDSNDGLTPDTPKKDYIGVNPQKGDTVLFKRGSFYRGTLETVEGVSYGAWGDGEAPVFCGSVNASDTSDWTEISKNIWKYTKETIGKVGNIILDNRYGTFRWEISDLCRQGDFYDSRQIDENKPQIYDSVDVLLFSKGNPASIYSCIEICHYGKRVLGYIKNDTAFDGLRFINSGVHGLAGQGKGVVIKNCTFENIGGVMFYKNTRVRFGNAVEFWQYGEDILIEGCSFKQVFDSCITHQGSRETVTPANNMIVRNNNFDSYGMAAFEYRDRIPVNSSFTDNVCNNAGCGFAMQGEELPRYSEIYPQPMGHHIFMWRMEKPSDGGSLLIENNSFGPAPVGSAIYSIISPEAEAQVTIRNNTYVENNSLLIRWSGKNYARFEDFEKENQYKKQEKA